MPPRRSSQQKLLQIEGVGDVTIAGSRLPAARIDLYLQALSNTESAWRMCGPLSHAENADSPKGCSDRPRARDQIYVNDTVTTPQQ